MFQHLSNLVYLAGVMVFLIPVSGLCAGTPEDDRITEYLAENSLQELLEVQLFDRFEREREPDVRIAFANQLGRIYLDRLSDDQMGDTDRKDYLLKGQVLVGLIPDNKLLELRLELLVAQYKAYEQVADLQRIGLLDAAQTDEAAVALDMLHSDFGHIARLADSDVESFNRQAARTSGESQQENERLLADARAVYSRASFFEGWAGYSLGVVTGREVDSSVFKAFGWVLGFDGNLPVLVDVDLDLLEYEHVARAMIGVALCKLHNREYHSSRLWLEAVHDSSVAAEFAKDFAYQRQVDVSLAEHDWKQALSQIGVLTRQSSASLVDVALARAVVLRTMEALQEDLQGRGGDETGTELVKVGLARLVELGEIGHVIDLLERFGSLPSIGNGFVGSYAQGVSEMMRAESSEHAVGFSDAAIRFVRALTAHDVTEYLDYAADAALKLVYCELRSDRPSAALRSLETYSEYLISAEQLEESGWLEILALDAIVRSGQEQMGVRLAQSLGAYIRAYPSSERANKLIVQYALSPYLEDVEALDGLMIEDPSNPLAIPARRKLVQMLYKNPELTTGGREQSNREIVEHAQWIWLHQPTDIENAREARERLAVCRIAVLIGLETDPVEHEFLRSAVDRMKKLIDSEPAFDLYRSELAFREVQVLLLEGEVDRAGAIAIGSSDLNSEHLRGALSMVFGRSHRRFMEQRNTVHAQSMVRYGRAFVEHQVVDPEDQLDARLSLAAESVAMGAMYIAQQTNDDFMRELALAYGFRVFEFGVPSEHGLVQTAELCEQYGRHDDALLCWNRLVQTLDDELIQWHRARYESLRLLKRRDSSQASEAYRQYKALHPSGSPEPWGGLIKDLFSEQEGGVP
jgi:hypothetical protein